MKTTVHDRTFYSSNIFWSWWRCYWNYKGWEKKFLLILNFTKECRRPCGEVFAPTMSGQFNIHLNFTSIFISIFVFISYFISKTSHLLSEFWQCKRYSHFTFIFISNVVSLSFSEISSSFFEQLLSSSFHPFKWMEI